MSVVRTTMVIFMVLGWTCGGAAKDTFGAQTGIKQAMRLSGPATYVDLMIGYSSPKLTLGMRGDTEAYCTKICNADTMVADGYNLALFGINPNNVNWTNGNALAYLQVYNKNSFNNPSNVYNYFNDGTKKSFLQNVVFSAHSYNLSEEICVGISGVGIQGVFSFQVRWVKDAITPRNKYMAYRFPQPTLTGSMKQFADLSNGAIPFSTLNFKPYQARIRFCQRPSDTTFTIELTAIGKGLTAFNSYMCPGYWAACDQTTPQSPPGFDESGSPLNTIRLTNSQVKTPDVRFSIFGFGGNPDQMCYGVFTIEYQG